jgi:hypothetical protein
MVLHFSKKLKSLGLTKTVNISFQNRIYQSSAKFFLKTKVSISVLFHIIWILVVHVFVFYYEQMWCKQQ